MQYDGLIIQIIMTLCNSKLQFCHNKESMTILISCESTQQILFNASHTIAYELDLSFFPNQRRGKPYNLA